MKTYWDYTEQERSLLTEEQVAALLNLELMSKGVVRPMPPALQPIVTPESLGGKRQCFAVSGKSKYGTDEVFPLAFSSADDVQKFMALNPVKIDYDYEVGTEYKYAMPLSDASISVCELYPYETINAAKVELKRNKAAADSNRKLQEAYEKACKDVDLATSGVWEDWNRCRNERAQMERIVSTFNDYAKLTNGDQFMALGFLEKAYSRDNISNACEWFPSEIPSHPKCVDVPQSEASDGF